jgi:hypothetical protein
MEHITYEDATTTIVQCPTSTTDIVDIRGGFIEENPYIDLIISEGATTANDLGSTDTANIGGSIDDNTSNACFW